MWISFGALFFLLGTSAFARQKIQLKEPVAQRLELVVQSGLELQQALFQDQEDRVQMVLTELQKLSKELVAMASHNPQAHTHLVKLANSLEGNARAAQRNSLDRRPQFMIEVFKSLVEMVRSYHLAKPPRIFFCNRDRSEWIQMARGPQNPVSRTEHPKCGVPAG